MKILVLGGDGMFGHRLFKYLSPRHEVKATLRQSLEAYKNFSLFNSENSFADLDLSNESKLMSVLAQYRPEAVVNATGIVKQRMTSDLDVIPSIEVNALFPHKLAAMCKMINSRVIQKSTDCVFSGDKGFYTESDSSDCRDLYGRSKFLGELHESHCVTLRTSMIGLELQRKSGLVEWFLEQKGPMRGFTKAIYSGITTLEMSRVIEFVLVEKPDLSGLWQVASEPISKYDLLCQFQEILGKQDIEIQPFDDFSCDRSLNGEAFCKKTGYRAPSWAQMLTELVDEIRQREKNR